MEDSNKQAKAPAWQFVDSMHSDAHEGFVQLFSPLDLQKYGLSNASQNPERDEHSRRVLDQLISSGPYRRFSFPEDTLEKLERLKPKVGNFAHVVDHIMNAISLSLCYRRPIKITPMLVVGEPGIGKTFFTHQLAGSLGVPLRRVPMDNLQVGASLAGSSYIYTNSEPGAVFKVLTREDHISPIILLDEIDKTGDNFAHGDPLSPLHNLLEPLSAKIFEDASFPFPIDASHVIWIATANCTDRIPATIRGRFDIFEIRSCGDEERLNVIEGICEELAGEYPGVEFEQELVSSLMERTPREQSQMLRRALSRASRFGESRVTLDHLEQATTEGGAPAEARSMGYTRPSG